jgi:hypothetical protein
MSRPAGYDVIGDIHGHLAALNALLAKLGYARTPAGWRCPDNRSLIFCGDLIDRGPENLGVIRLVRDLCEAGHARMAMGNHEYNALCFHTLADPARGAAGMAEVLASGPEEDQWLRSHNTTHLKQHQETWAEMKSFPEETQGHLKWMGSLPLWLELEGLRIVHACWDAREMARFGPQIDEPFLQRAWGSWDYPQQSAEFLVVETLLKGPEIELPAGNIYHDKEGTERHRARLRWWLAGGGLRPGALWREICLLPDSCQGKALEQPVADETRRLLPGYPTDAPPVLVGHYWLDSNQSILAPNVGCVDWSIARAGKLAAYRWSGEQTLSQRNFTSVNGVK